MLPLPQPLDDRGVREELNSYYAGRQGGGGGEGRDDDARQVIRLLCLLTLLWLNPRGESGENASSSPELKD